MNQADIAVKYALAQVGKPYKFGAAGPDAFDCSGLIKAAYATAGVVLPHSTYLMVNMGVEVSPANLAPGDLVFPEAGHVQMWLGNGKIVEAPTTGIPVRVVNQWGGIWHARRVTAQPGTGATVAGNGSVDSVANVTPAGLSIGDVGSALGDIGKALSFIVDPHNWIRVVEFLAGLALVMFALYRLADKVGTP
ncbi:MAG TPA: C40 family peptidase [Arthrobacter sp.]|nr:C40 family peptidase [Arthrobacter sp.]